MSGLESLHRILKDEKRRKILISLDEKDALTYTDLLNALEIKSTGKLNYHLKVLNELITKRENGSYILTGKGKLAVKLLKEFNERKSQAQLEAAPPPRGYYIVVCLFTVAVVGLDFVFFALGQVAISSFVENLALAVLAVVFLVAAERARAKRLLWQPNRQRLGAAVSIVFAGAFAGGVGLFFIGGLALFGLAPQSVHRVFPTFDSWIVTSFVVGAVFGGLVGYLIYRRSRLSDPEYYKPF